MYNLVSTAIRGMGIGDSSSIAIPDNLKYFRKYLCEISKRENKKFTTKVIEGKLQIMRVKYHNHYSKEVQE